MTTAELNFELWIFAAVMAIGGLVTFFKHATRQTALQLKHPYARS